MAADPARARAPAPSQRTDAAPLMEQLVMAHQQRESECVALRSVLEEVIPYVGSDDDGDGDVGW